MNSASPTKAIDANGMTIPEEVRPLARPRTLSPPSSSAHAVTVSPASLAATARAAALSPALTAKGKVARTPPRIRPTKPVHFAKPIAWSLMVFPTLRGGERAGPHYRAHRYEFTERFRVVSAERWRPLSRGPDLHLLILLDVARCASARPRLPLIRAPFAIAYCGVRRGVAFASMAGAQHCRPIYSRAS